MILNWYKIIKKSSPLIDIGGYPDDYGGGISAVNDVFTPENVKKFREDFPYITGLEGYGSFGIAYDAGNSIVKLTTDKTEKEMAEKINNDKIKNKDIFPYIYKIKEYETNSFTIYAIEMEKVEILSYNERMTYINVEELIEDFFHTNLSTIYNFDEIYEKMKDEIEKKDLRKDIEEKTIKMLKEYIELHKKLKENDLLADDLHPENVGWKNDQLVILDLGQIT